MIRFINNLFECKYTENPMTVFGDHHIRRSGIIFSPNTITIASIKHCLNHLVNICHGQNSTTHDVSHRNILHAVKNNCLQNIQHTFGYRSRSGANHLEKVNQEQYQKFVDYKNCLGQVNNTFQRCCSSSSVSQCKRCHIQALKTIRLPMDMMDRILADTPTMKLVYYVRDPRGIIASRAAHKPLLTYDPFTEAKLLCRRMLSDLRIFSDLQKKYPSRTLQVIYEDFTTEPQEMLKKLYTFLGEEITSEVRVGIHRVIGQDTGSLNFKKNVGDLFSVIRHNASTTAQSWRQHMEPALKMAVTNSCSDVLSKLNYVI